MTTDTKTAAAANTNLAQQTVNLIKMSSVALERSVAIEKDAAEKQAAATQLIPGVVDALVAHQRIGEHEREAMTAKLASHTDTLAVLRALAGHRNPDELDRIGQASEKTAAATSAVSDADRKFYMALGLAPPSA